MTVATEVDAMPLRRVELFAHDMCKWLAERGWNIEVRLDSAQEVITIGQRESPFCLYVQDWDFEFADVPPWVKGTIGRWHKFYAVRHDSLPPLSRRLLARYFGTARRAVEPPVFRQDRIDG